LLVGDTEKAFADQNANLRQRLLFLQCTLPSLHNDSTFQWERWLSHNFQHVLASSASDIVLEALQERSLLRHLVMIWRVIR